MLLGKHLHNWQELKTTPVDVDPTQWNRMEVKLDGDELVILLNDCEVLRFEDRDTGLRNGKVAFRNWGADVSYRSLTIGKQYSCQTVDQSNSTRSAGMWDAFC